MAWSGRGFGRACRNLMTKFFSQASGPWCGRIARAVAWCLLAAVCAPQAWAQVCAAPGVSGALTVATANTQVNTYYSGTAAGGTAGGTTLGYTSGSPRGATAIGAGDLVLVIQMQDGTGATTTNTSAYSFPATAAGTYEFARVVSVGTNLLNLSAALSNTYTQNTAVANNQTYQVIRVPQYATLTINAGASIVPAPWDGTSGGVVAADVSGALTNNGSVDASYAGFRGNAGLSLSGMTGAPAQTLANFDRVQPDTYTAHGGKGEGTAGSPNRMLTVFSSPGVLLTSGTTSANGTATNATTANQGISSTAAYLTATTRSYNGGSRAAGAPGNAGGGGDDSAPAGNGENSGGGGGGNSGTGGAGGNTWNTNLAIGGRGGIASAPAIANKLTMGGGGGSGTTNNGFGQDTSGGAGGGLIFLKAGTVGGTGALLANGQAGRSIPTKAGGADCPANSTNNCDGGGGGGAGGGIVVVATSGTLANAQVRGGQGGNINGTQHGPGGGGGGGFIVTSSGLGVTTLLTGGAAGLTNLGGTSAAYGAAAGANGAASTVLNTALPANAGGLPANCRPALSTTKLTSTPALISPVSPPSTTTYSIVVVNPAGEGDARGVTLYDPSLPGGSATVANPPLPTFSFSAAPSACALGARTTTVDPANGATSTFTAGAFTLPGGCTLTYTFTVNVPTTLPNGTYSNSAVAFFLDPTDSSGTRTVTAALPAAATGLAANTAFTTGGTVGGSNYDGNNLANTADDILVKRVANLQLTKNDGVTAVVAGATTSYTLTVANLGPADGAGTVLADPATTGLTCTAVTCAVAAGAAACPAPASVTIANLQSPPGPGITLSTLPAASTLTFAVSCGVTATGQ
ncbi:MAG: hypothetical protein JWQ72_3548 [Polaromonas sp.]|nr:hypothetical protein [Polaromonas sp.]